MRRLHLALQQGERERGVKVGDVLRWDGVPPMYVFDDPDGNRFYIVEATR